MMDPGAALEKLWALKSRVNRARLDLETAERHLSQHLAAIGKLRLRPPMHEPRYKPGLVWLRGRQRKLDVLPDRE